MINNKSITQARFSKNIFFTQLEEYYGYTFSSSFILALSTDNNGVDRACVVLEKNMYKYNPSEPNTWWSLPGGVVEVGETAWSSAVREWQEETGRHFPTNWQGLGYMVGNYHGKYSALFIIYLGSGNGIKPGHPNTGPLYNNETLWFDYIKLSEIDNALASQKAVLTVGKHKYQFRYFMRRLIEDYLNGKCIM